MNHTICISCGEPMAPGADRAPSLGNPNQCVPCCTGHQLPAEGSAAYRATDGPTTLPPATAPAACISGDAGPETTAAGGNSLTSDLYVATPQNADRYTGHTEAAASEVNPFQAGRWTPARIVGADRSDRTITVEVPSASGVVIGDHVALSRGCIKCGAPIDEPWLATVCCADCRAGFRTKAPTRSGVHYMGPSYSPEDCDAWRMLL